MKAIKSRLAVIGTEFSQNLLADERSWYMELSDDDLEGSARVFNRGEQKCSVPRRVLASPIVTLSRSIIVPFLQFSPQRDLRERPMRHGRRAGRNDGATDNRALAAEMLALRQEMAELLGYHDFASFKLETEMAKTPENVS